jgi:Tfp pilus assembly protein PilN
MPIRINLLADAQAAEESRRKDPVKRAVWIGAFAVFVVLLWAATLQFKIIVARSEVSGLQASWKAIEKQAQEINDHKASTRNIEQKLSAVDQFTTNRMLWATTLNALQHTSVDGVQLTRVRTEQSFTLNEGKRPTVTERITLSLEGRDFGSGSTDHVPQFKESLAAYPYFKSNLQTTNNVQLTSLSAPQTEGARAFRAFGIQLYFQEKERQLYE